MRVPAIFLQEIASDVLTEWARIKHVLLRSKKEAQKVNGRKAIIFTFPDPLDDATFNAIADFASKADGEMIYVEVKQNEYVQIFKPRSNPGPFSLASFLFKT